MPGQIWAVNSLGGWLYNSNLSNELRHSLQPESRFRQFCDVKDAAHQGQHKGSKFHWDVISDVATDGGTVSETVVAPETQFTITQGTITVTESINSIPYSGKLEDLSFYQVRDMVRKPLKNDAKKTLDRHAFDQWNTTVLRVVPASGTSTTSLALTTNGTATATNNVALKKQHIGLVVDTMKERNIPPYQADDYYAIAWPSTYRTLRNDLEGVRQYVTQGFQMIMNGEVGRYEGVRFIEQTNVAKGGAADSTTYTNSTADAWNKAKSDWVFFFGEETCAEAIVVPEEIRAKTPTDYGRAKGIAWYYLGGFGLVHTAVAQARIVKWDSAS